MKSGIRVSWTSVKIISKEETYSKILGTLSTRSEVILQKNGILHHLQNSV